VSQSNGDAVIAQIGTTSENLLFYNRPQLIVELEESTQLVENVNVEMFATGNGNGFNPFQEQFIFVSSQ
jgi:hypothetical protein